MGNSRIGKLFWMFVISTEYKVLTVSNPICRNVYITKNGDSMPPTTSYRF